MEHDISKCEKDISVKGNYVTVPFLSGFTGLMTFNYCLYILYPNMMILLFLVMISVIIMIMIIRLT